MPKANQLPLPVENGEAGRYSGGLRTEALRQLMSDVAGFSAQMSGMRLRGYQAAAGRAIVDSVVNQRGLSIVVMFPRQSGKNELQAQIETYLLAMFHLYNVEIVKVCPTWKPQAINAMNWLERVLHDNHLVAKLWTKEKGYIYRIDRARLIFLSGAPTSNVVGATASLMLECDEAQDVEIAKWDKEINPMGASKNATRVFWGTAWTSQTLLAREMQAARQAEQLDGRKRVFLLTADEVGKEVPAYADFVRSEVAKHGRNHPFIMTQYYSETIDASGGMFPPERRALMVGAHPPQMGPNPGETYAFLLDFAGSDEANSITFQDAALKSKEKKDSTALTVIRIDLSQYDLLKAPVYQVLMRRQWTGEKHTNIYSQLISLADTWNPRYIVCDATGVGAGITSFLARSYGESFVIPFVFSGKSKSDLGWNFISVIENGRFKDHARPADDFSTRNLSMSNQEIFWQQIENCQNEMLPGPGRIMRWGVPDDIRDQVTGMLIHDDLLISAALCSVLDEQTWGLAASEIIPGYDPISSLHETY